MSIFDKIFEELKCDSKNDTKIIFKYKEEIEKINPKLFAIFKLLLISKPTDKKKFDNIKSIIKDEV